jgi:membrane-associated HD superfamily phosphohydrolase
VKKGVLIVCFFLLILLLLTDVSMAQCSICTKTAQQLGEKPAKGLNAGILYLAFTPYVIIGYIAYRWWKKNRAPVE